MFDLVAFYLNFILILLNVQFSAKNLGLNGIYLWKYGSLELPLLNVPFVTMMMYVVSR